MTIKVITSLESMPNFNTEKPVFCDIETQGLYINTRLIQFYQYDETPGDSTIYILDLAPIGYDKSNYETLLQETKEYMKTLWLVFYNASYDLGTLNIVPNKLDDLFYSVRTAYWEFGVGNYSLDQVTESISYTKGLYSGIDKKKLQKAGFILGAYLSQEQLKYSALDVLSLAIMWEDKRILDVMSNNLAYKVDILSLRYAIQYQQNGLYVDLETRNKQLLDTYKTIESLEKELPSTIQITNSKNEVQTKEFNVNSYIHVRKYLNTSKSDHDSLVKYAMSDKLLAKKARVIIDLKRAKKELSYLESINFKRMITKFNPAGAATGRFSSSGGDLDNGFNAQQIPRRFQPLFKSDIEIGGVNTCVIGLDYSTLELRLACTIFGDETMYKQLMDGKDLHTEMAIMSSGKKLHPEKGLLGSDYDTIHDSNNKNIQWLTKTDRTLAKSINFGYVFGMSSDTYKNYAFVSYGVEVSSEESKRLRETYFNKYPKFKQYHQMVWNNYKKPNFYYETALGRRVKPNLGTDGINGPVQGSGAETTKLAVHYLIKAYPEAIKLIFNVVHDAIYLRVPKEDKQLWIDRLSESMVKGWTEISKSTLFKFKDIPMPVGD